MCKGTRDLSPSPLCNLQCRPPKKEEKKKTQTRPMGLIKMLGDENWLETIACEKESGQLLHLAPKEQLSKLPFPVVTSFFIALSVCKWTGQLQVLSATFGQTTATRSTEPLFLLITTHFWHAHLSEHRGRAPSVKELRVCLISFTVSFLSRNVIWWRRCLLWSLRACQGNSFSCKNNFLSVCWF